LALTDRSNFPGEWCQHRNNTVGVPGSEWPNPITRPFDTETDSDPDPDLASPWTFSDGLRLEVVRKGSCFQPALPKPIRRASRRGRGGVFDQAVRAGRSNAVVHLTNS